MRTKDWLIACVIGAGLMFAVMETGCTANLRSDVTFNSPGVYECTARSPGYEDLPVYVVDTETADPLYRQGIGTSSTLTLTTVDGERITFDVDASVVPGYYCVQTEARDG